MARNHTKRNTTPAATTEAATHQTFAEVLAETGETVEELQAQPEAPAERKQREPGTSNLATTISRFRHTYAVALAPSGKKTANNGDWVARTLLLVPQPVLERFVHGRFGRSYDALNNGHRRMCCGNLVRAAIKKGDVEVTAWLAGFEPKQDEQDDSAE